DLVSSSSLSIGPKMPKRSSISLSNRKPVSEVIFVPRKSIMLERSNSGRIVSLSFLPRPTIRSPSIPVYFLHHIRWLTRRTYFSLFARRIIPNSNSDPVSIVYAIVQAPRNDRGLPKSYWTLSLTLRIYRDFL